MTDQPVISIVDDDPSVREGMLDLLTSMGFVAETFSRAEEFLNSDCLNRTVCLISDVQLPGMTGLELYNHLGCSGRIMPTILITAFPNDKDRTRALRDGVRSYLTKPHDDAELLACIRAAFEQRETDLGGEHEHN